jgi:hypothetical protein
MSAMIIFSSFRLSLLLLHDALIFSFTPFRYTFLRRPAHAAFRHAFFFAHDHEILFLLYFSSTPAIFPLRRLMRRDRRCATRGGALMRASSAIERLMSAHADIRA